MALYAAGKAAVAAFTRALARDYVTGAELSVDGGYAA
ncbi:Uncharacterised protein [Bordetella pertussis]|nr:Uncharacterised protein [Bordetella pertussis]